MTQNQSKPRFGILAVAAWIILFAALMAAESIIIPIILALFISIICVKPVRWLESKRVGTNLSVSIVLIGVLVLLLVVGAVIGGAIGGFSEEAALYEARLDQMTDRAFKGLVNWGIDTSNLELSDAVDPAKLLGYTAQLVSGLGGVLGNSALIAFIVIFMLLEHNSFPLKSQAIASLSGGKRSEISDFGNSIRHYLEIKTIVSLITGFTIWIGLIIIGVNHAVLWALLAFLLNYIPNIGSIIAMVPAVMFALVQLGFGSAVWTGIVYLVVNMVAGNMIEPRMLGKGMGLSTLVVFLSLIFWGYIFGTAGMFLSIPLTMSIKIILDRREKPHWLSIVLGTGENARQILEENEGKYGEEETGS